MNDYHTSVLLQQTIDLLNVQVGKKYIDATLGGSGHTTQILELGGKVLGIDTDQDALDYVEEKFRTENLAFSIGKELILAKGNFKDIDKLATEHHFEHIA